MHVCFSCVCFSFSVLRQEIGCEERLPNELCRVEWDARPQLNQSISVCHLHHISYRDLMSEILCVCCVDENDFIVDDEGRPISKGKRKRHIIHDDALVPSLLFTSLSVVKCRDL